MLFISSWYAVTRAALQPNSSLSFTASEDTFIAESNVSATNPTAAVLWINNKPGFQRRALVKFLVAGIPAGAVIQSAQLQLYVSNGSRSNGSLDSSGYVAQVLGTWSETTTTWSNAPALGAKIADLAPVGSASPGETKSADVGAAVAGNGEVSFYIIDNSPTYDDIFYTSSNATTTSAGTGFITPTLSVAWVDSSTPTSPAQSTPTPTPVPAGVNITYGPIAGGVTDSSAKIFGRTDTAAPLQVEYSPDSTFSTSAFSNLVTTASDSDYTGIVDLTGLTANTLYYYRFVGDKSHSVYQFRTYPDPGQPASFSFAVFSDLASDNINAPAYAQAALGNPAFAMQIGDFPHFNPAVAPTPVTIANWWNVDKKAIGGLLSGQDLKNNILNKFPFIHIWDDHDYGKNNLAYNNPYKYTMALPAFKSYFPTYPLVNPAEGLWQSFQYGSNTEFFVLDLRSQRSPDGKTDGPSKSMLDAQKLANSQKTWLLNGLKNSTATWKFIISSSVWNKKAKPNDDSWNLYQNEQQQIIDFIKANHIKNVIVFSGDIHSGGAIDAGTGLSALTGGCTDPTTQTWCIPELSIPHTNVVVAGCTGSPVPAPCGMWDQGVIDPVNDPAGGYGWVTVNGDQSVTLYAVRQDGFIRLQYTVNAK